MLFDEHRTLNSPYNEALLVAQEEGDIAEALAIEKMRLGNIEQMKKRGMYNDGREHKMRPDHFIIGFVPEIACNRLFSDPSTMADFGYDAYEWNRIESGRFIEHGDAIFTVGNKKYKMDIKSRKLYGKIDNSWAELNENQISKGDKGYVDGYLFCQIDRENGIVYVAGYLMHTQLVELIRQGIKVDNGLTYMQAGTQLASGWTAPRAFWRIPYSRINRFPGRVAHGDFKEAKNVATRATRNYPLFVREYAK